jgi:hypothetical protein
MKEFDYYLNSQNVKKNSPNLALAKSLIEDMKSRIKEISDIAPEKTKIIFENTYDVLRDFCDALLAVEGYKSYSHEASISFLLKKGFDIATVTKLDKFRYKRNGSEYYGTKVTTEDVNAVEKFYSTNKEKLFNTVKKLGLS